MKVRGDVYPPKYYVDTRSDGVSQIYHRTNVQEYEETDENGQVMRGFEYDEEIIPKE